VRPIALSFAIACTALAPACGGGGSDGANPTPTPTPTPAPVAPSAIYTSTNDTAGNMVLVYERGADGSLSTNKPKAYATGGAGTGASLSDQGALAFDSTWTKLFVVNAGDDSVSMLAVEGDGTLTLLANVPSGGTHPVSVTVSGDLLYVLNAGDATHAGGISGFRITTTLTAVAGSIQPLSTASAGPAQISFAPGTNVLVVTEKATNSIDTYVVAADGSASAPDVQASAGNVPYGFAFSGDGHLLVTEAMTAAVSSYSIAANGTLTVVTPSSSTGGQNAPCWMSAAGAYGWSANAASNTVTSYSVAADGSLTNLGSITAGNKPLDQAISPDGKYLYVLDGQDHGISVFGINGNGTLSGQLELSGLPVTAAGLIAR
jgi:6-phosphogluconolactonase